MNSTREFISLHPRVRDHLNKFLKNEDFKLSKIINYKLRFVFFMIYEWKSEKWEILIEKIFYLWDDFSFLPYCFLGFIPLLNKLIIFVASSSYIRLSLLYISLLFCGFPLPGTRKVCVFEEKYKRRHCCRTRRGIFYIIL